jgi:hypothetical protein
MRLWLWIPGSRWRVSRNDGYPLFRNPAEMPLMVI